MTGVAVTDLESLTDMVWANAERFGDAVSFRGRADHSWLDVTARAFAGTVLSVAKGLIAAGMRPGDRVALRSANRFEWSLADFAIWTAGCVTVPIGHTLPAAEVGRALAGSGARGVVVAAERDRGLGGGLPAWRLDGELADLGAGVDDEVAHARRLAVGADDLATVHPDLTHRELLGQVRAAIARYSRELGAGRSMLIRLPMTHPLARVMALCGVYTRTTLALADESTSLADLATFRPTVVVTRPALLEQIHDAVRDKAYAEDRGRFFDLAEAVAVEYGRAMDGWGPGVALRGRHAVASRFAYPKLRVALGGRCTAVITAGRPAREHLEYFFRGIGVTVHSV